MAGTTSGLLSFTRVTSLACLTLVGIGSGANYIYSVYAPQLGARLHITQTQLNIIGLSGNIGVHSTGPIWGRIVDSQGPRSLFGAAFVLLLGGYSGIWRIYDAGLPPSDKTLSIFSLCVLVFCSFMTGAGSCSGTAGAVNSTAKSFPDRARATTTAIVLSGYGLSAFLFSAVANAAFPGNRSSLLLLLAVGTSFPMILGFFFVHPIPLPVSNLMQDPQYTTHYQAVAAAESCASITFHDGDDRIALLSLENDHDVQSGNTSSNVYQTIPQDLPIPSESTANYVEPTLLRDVLRRIIPGHPRSASERLVIGRDEESNIYGLDMWTSGDFWITFVVMSLLTGTGLMYINNVGSISHALFAKANPNYDNDTGSRLQAVQVSTISLSNSLGRILIGLTADFIKNQLHRPRTYCTVLVSFLFVVSQISCLGTDDAQNLWKTSALLGLAYGGIYGLFPTIVIEHFGLPHFSENWGYMLLSPLIGGGLFALAFGLQPVDLPLAHQCLQGRECYVTSLYMTVSACSVALILSMWAGYRDRQKMLAREGPS